jgi:AcrR family transcriptional regulator
MSAERATRQSLRDVSRRAVRSEITSKAMALFVEHGFDQTTVDQIGKAVGISARSVFRYFATKEDIVLGNSMDIGLDLAAALDACQLDEPPWQAIRRALDEPLRALRVDGAAALAMATMLARTPSLRAARLERLAQWEELLVPNIARRVDGPEQTRQLRAHAITSCAMSCLNAAINEWTRLDGARPLDELFDLAIGAALG